MEESKEKNGWQRIISFKDTTIQRLMVDINRHQNTITILLTIIAILFPFFIQANFQLYVVSKSKEYVPTQTTIQDRLNIDYHYSYPDCYTISYVEPLQFKERAVTEIRDIETHSVLVRIRNESEGAQLLRVLEIYTGPNFEFNKSELASNSSRYYRKLAEIFLFKDRSFTKVREFMSIVTLGFADPAGPESFNYELSENRAIYIKEEILAQVYPPIKHLVKIIGKGEELIDYETSNIRLQKEISDSLGISFASINPLDVKVILENIGDADTIALFKYLTKSERDSLYDSDVEKYKAALKKFRVVYIIGVVGSNSSIRTLAFIKRNFPIIIIFSYITSIILLFFAGISVIKRVKSRNADYRLNPNGG